MRLYISAAFAALFLVPSLAVGQGHLAMHVVNVRDRPLEGVRIGTRGDGSNAFTDQAGRIRLRLAPQTIPGSKVDLQLIGASANEWVFITPWNSRVLVPPFENKTDNYVQVLLGRKGDKTLLQLPEVSKAMVQRISAAISLVAPSEDEVSYTKRYAVLEKAAHAFGLKVEEVEEELADWAEWAQRKGDPYEKGLAAFYEENYPEAARQFEKSFQAREEVLHEAQREAVDAALLLGNALYFGGKPEDAFQAYKRAIGLDPDYALAYTNRGVAYASRGDYQKAVADFKRAIKFDSSDALTYYNRGLTYHRQGEYETAIADYNRATELNPDYAIAYANRGTAYDRQGSYNKAMADYKRAIELKPDGPLAYYNRGVAYTHQGDYEKAISDFSRVIELDPIDSFAYERRGFSHASRGSYEKAVSDFNRAIELDSAYALAYANRGAAHASQNSYEKAVVDFKRSIELDPDYVLTYSNYAYLLAERDQQLDRSLQMARYAVSIQPENASFMGTLGWVHYKRGEIWQAKDWLDKALSAGGSSYVIYEHRGDVAAALGNRDRARGYWQMALALSPGRDSLRQKLKAATN